MSGDTKPKPGQTNPIITRRQDGVTTLIMNTPERLNGWTMEMMDALKEGLRVAV
jgi:enoyl-CoA hydratase/carnithine racemase